MTTPIIEAIANADAQLTNAGLPSYSELMSMLREAQHLGLDFDRGNAYITRAYVDHQTELNSRINTARAASSI